MLLNYISVLNSASGKKTFTQLYQRYESEMYHIAYSILHDKFLSEDAVNEAFIKIIKYLPHIKNTDCKKTKALIITTVRSTAIDIYRKRKKQFQYEIKESEKEKNNDKGLLDHIIVKEDFCELILSLKEIRKEYYEIIILKYVYELSNKQIGSFMNISDTLVRQHICRAKKIIKKLKEENNH